MSRADVARAGIRFRRLRRMRPPVRARSGRRVPDLPSVVEGTPGLLAEAGVAERCEVVGGDMFAGVPEAGDLYILSRVIDSFDDARAVAVLANCRRAMGARGRLLLVEPVLPDRVETAVSGVTARPVQNGTLSSPVSTGGGSLTHFQGHPDPAHEDIEFERLVDHVDPRRQRRPRVAADEQYGQPRDPLACRPGQLPPVHAVRQPDVGDQQVRAGGGQDPQRFRPVSRLQHRVAQLGSGHESALSVRLVRTEGQLRSEAA